jgi:hypothetical protein
MRFILAFIMLIHGIIHLMGFSKAFHLGNVPNLTKNVSKPIGLLWLLTTLLFITSDIFLLLKKQEWWIIAAFAILFSQSLIALFWKDAKVGTVANAIILIFMIVNFKINFL